MNKYMRLMAIKGLIMSMDDQLFQHFQKDNLPENIKTIIVSKYYDSILEQLEQPEDIIKKKFIIALYKQEIISQEQKIELLNQSEKEKENCPVSFEFNIIVNGKRHIIHLGENKKISWEEVVLLSDLAKTGKEILTITFNYNQDDIRDSGGVLEVNESIEVKEGMIFNVCNTSKGEK